MAFNGGALKVEEAVEAVAGAEAVTTGVAVVRRLFLGGSLKQVSEEEEEVEEAASRKHRSKLLMAARRVEAEETKSPDCR